jgi:zeaxanthin glucosyltransferase
MRIGFISMPLSGHSYPMTTLARKLQSRGHEPLFIGVPDAAPIVEAAGLEFVSYCETEYPVGSIAETYAPISKMYGLEVTRYNCPEIAPSFTEAPLEQLPRKLTEAGIKAFVVDTIHFYMELVPLSLIVPYVHIWNILHVNFSGASPARFFGWPYDTSPEAKQRNGEGSMGLRSEAVSCSRSIPAQPER